MFVVLFLALTLPGFFLSVIVVRKEHVLLLAMPLSVTLYVAIVVLLAYFGKTNLVFSCYFVTGVLLAGLAFLRPSGRTDIVDALKPHSILIPLGLLIVAYQLIVGPFIDFGVDLFRHMSLTQLAMREIDSTGGQLRIVMKPGTGNFFFHNIAAWTMWTTGMSTAQLIRTISIAYSLLWTLSVYLFCRAVLAMLGVTKNRLMWFAILGVVFYWFGFGINHFSFPRYYIGGPAILTHGMLLAATVILLEQLRSRLETRQLVILGSVIVAMGILHPQEVLLLVSFMMSLAIVLIAKPILRLNEFRDIPVSVRNLILAVTVLIFVVAGIVSAIYFFPKYTHDPIPLYNLGQLSQRLIAWNILRPEHQFFTVVGWWGIFTIALVVVLVKKCKKYAVVLALLIYPLVTVFNPVFAEAVMKLSYPAVLWRVLFGFHVPILACYGVWVLLSSWQSVGNIGKVLRTAALGLLALLLLPFSVGGFSNELVKAVSLTKTPASNSYQIWNELLNFFAQKKQPVKVLTDPVTAFAIRSMTNHIVYGYKFFPNRGYRQINFESYDTHPLAKYKGWFLVVNKRDGPENTRLKPPHHIYPDVLSVERYYSESLLEEIRDRNDRYRKVWEFDEQTVFEIL